MSRPRSKQLLIGSVVISGIFLGILPLKARQSRSAHRPNVILISEAPHAHRGVHNLQIRLSPNSFGYEVLDSSTGR